MTAKTKSVRITNKNYRALKKVQKEAQVKVPLEALANAAINLGIYQLDIFNKARNT